MGTPAKKALKLVRPNVIDYHDYRAFLRDWFSYLEGHEDGFSLRKLAREAAVSVSSLSMILRGHRGLSHGTFERLREHLRLNETECRHLELLREMSESTSVETRARVIGEIQRRPKYRARHPKEFETFNYLKSWYHVAIREMAALPDFRFDPLWIQSRLREQVPLEDVSDALVFLEQHGFIERGKVGVAQKVLDCIGGVFRLALGAFHKEMLDQVHTAIDNVPSDKRHVLGHTFAVSSEKLGEVKAILDEAMGKIEKLGVEHSAAATPPDAVYHVTLAAVPLTVNKGDSNE